MFNKINKLLQIVDIDVSLVVKWYDSFVYFIINLRTMLDNYEK